jgi:hypothetical protein
MTARRALAADALPRQTSGDPRGGVRVFRD